MPVRLLPSVPGLGVGLLPEIWDLAALQKPLGQNADPEALPVPLPTSGAVGDDGHGEVHLVGVHVWGGADGIVAGLQQGQLGQEQGGGHLDGRELLQHLHDGGVLAPFPFLVLLQTLCQGEGHRSCTPFLVHISSEGIRMSGKKVRTDKDI